MGVPYKTINYIEKGRFKPFTTLALKISEVFGKTVNELFELE